MRQLGYFWSLLEIFIQAISAVSPGTEPAMPSTAYNRVDLEQLAVAIRRRASVLSKEPRPPAVEDALITLVSQANGSTPDSTALAKILTGMAGVAGSDTTYERSDLDVLKPRVIRRLDLLLDALIDGRCTQEGLREALRPLRVRWIK
jgi:hypothetical protein